MAGKYRWVAVLGVVAAVGCGDPETNDNRGYTKAPLEHPTVLIRGEEPSPMAALGAPNQTRARELRMPEPVAAADAGTTDTGPDFASIDLPEGVTTAMIETGETIYSGAGNCFTCHGIEGAGSPLAPELNDSEWLHIAGGYDEIVQIITAGVPQPMQYPAAMPAMGGAQLDEQQIRDVAAYVFAISR